MTPSEAIEARCTAALRGTRKRTTYEVCPRYTCGSPAPVDRATACRVALEETLRCSQRTPGGDLSGICWTRRDSRNRVYVTDLCTGEAFEFASFAAYCLWTARARAPRNQGAAACLN